MHHDARLRHIGQAWERVVLTCEDVMIRRAARLGLSLWVLNPMAYLKRWQAMAQQLSETELRRQAVQALSASLCPVDALRFLALISREPFDY